jgi:hypothetical protein
MLGRLRDKNPWEGNKTVQHSEAMKKHLNQLSIICSAILGEVAIFAGVVWYLLNSGSMPPQDLDLPSWMSTLINVAALIALLKAQFLPRLFGSPGPNDPEEAWLAWHKRTTIVGFALREAAAFMALVGAMLTGQLVGAILMVGLAFLTMILAWPRADQLGG